MHARGRTGRGHAADSCRPGGSLSRAGLWYGGKSRLVALMPSSAPHRPDPTRARYETLLEVAESIAAHRQLSTLFADLSRLLKRLVPFDFISLTLLDPKERMVRLHILETGATPRATARRARRSTRLPPSSRCRRAALITSPIRRGEPLSHHPRTAARQRHRVGLYPAAVHGAARDRRPALRFAAQVCLPRGRHRIYGAGGAPGRGGGG